MKTGLMTFALLLGIGTFAAAADPPAVLEQTAESRIAVKAWSPRIARLGGRLAQTEDDQIQLRPWQQQQPYLWDSARPVRGPSKSQMLILDRF